MGQDFVLLENENLNILSLGYYLKNTEENDNSSYYCDSTTVNLISNSYWVDILCMIMVQKHILTFLFCLLLVSFQLDQIIHTRQSSVISFAYVFEVCPCRTCPSTWPHPLQQNLLLSLCRVC